MIKRCACHLFTAGVLVLGISEQALAAQPQPPVNIVITNAKIWTGNPAQPDAQTLLISGDRIQDVGGNDLARGLLDNQNIQVIDAGGRRVIPAMADCHTHIISGGLNLARLQLRQATDKQDFIRRVKEYAQAHADEAWIVGRGWTTESWKDSTQPTKEWIDAVTGGRPAFLRRMDGHQGLANSRALEIAGITSTTADPEGGRIGKDPTTGEPNGVLKDAAMGLLSRHIPAAGKAQRLEALARAKRLFNQYGIAMVHDMSDPDDGNLFTIALPTQTANPDSGRLRIMSYCQQSEWSGRMPFRLPLLPHVEDWVRPAGFKGYMDGSLGSRTAYMAKPYLDNPPHQKDNRGLRIAFATREAPHDMYSQFRRAARGRLQPAVHAIGDQGNHLLLNAYEELKREFPDARPRVEHVQHLLSEDIGRFEQLGAIASMQPLHKADDGRYAEQRIGYERCKSSYAFKSLLASGAVVCFGSDWPVVSNNPFEAMEAAVTGKTLEGKAFVPEQNITAEQALKCYTVNAAYACLMENRWGMIKPGYLADVAILDQDVLSVDADKIGDTQADVTIVGGQVVWQRAATKTPRQW